MNALEQVKQSKQPGFNAREAGKLIGRDPRTLIRACRDGQIAAHKIGHQWFISRETMLELLGDHQ